MSPHDTRPGRVHTETGPLIWSHTGSNLRGLLTGFHSRTGARVEPPTPHSVVQRNVAQHVAGPQSTLSGSRLPRNFVRGWGVSTNSVEDRERGSGGGSPLVRGSGDSCNLVQEISFHTVKFS